MKTKQSKFLQYLNSQFINPDFETVIVRFFQIASLIGIITLMELLRLIHNLANHYS